MRVVVACINWTHAVAPHAMSYILRGDEVITATWYHATWDEAMEHANRIAKVWRSASAVAS